MINAIQKVESFRSKREQIASIWTIADQRVYGLLKRDGIEPIIEISFEETGLKTRENTEHPILLTTKPPNKTTIIGFVEDLGQISLKECLRVSESRSFDLQKELTKHLIALRPSAIWCGSCDDDEEFSSLTLFDDRLVGFFGQPGFSQHLQWDAKLKDVFERLENPSAIWTFHRNQLCSFQLAGSPINISVGSTMTNSFSATSGYSLRSFNYVSLSAHSPIPAKILKEIKIKIEQVFSTFSLGSFSFSISEFEHFERGSPPRNTVCLWSLGESRSIFAPPMRHQILVDFSKEGVFNKILNKWIKMDEITSLSIWLFCKSLDETEDGTSRFIAVAQALEVVGRAIGVDRSVEKQTIRNICETIRAALTDVDESYRNRIIGLVESSNRSSFRDSLNHMLLKAARHLEIDVDATQISAFSKTISDTRNNIVHMTKNKNKLSQAFSIVNKLSLRVTFWYAVIIAEQFDLETPGWQSFLY